MLLNGAGSVLDGLENILNMPIQMPLFSNLYKMFVSGGKRPHDSRRGFIYHSYPHHGDLENHQGHSPALVNRGDFAKHLDGVNPLKEGQE